MNYIVCLTRGYSDKSKYGMLINRTLSIIENVPGDWLMRIFHEDDLTPDHRKYISDICGIYIEFINLHTICGYEGMCRFQMFCIWKYFNPEDNILRVDEDCIISECPNDPFEQLQDYVYLKSVYWAESHSETNATLPQYIESITGADRKDFYNNKYPYTNVGLAKCLFFKGEIINWKLQQIAYNPDQQINRWGDLPVIGSLLNIYAQGRVGTLTGMKYHHISHNTLINC